MGCNFYLADVDYFGVNMDDPKYHIGKRSAAGLYCYDCSITLCKNGEKGIHEAGDDKWHPACPKCGQKPNLEILLESAGGRELGFCKKPRLDLTGVHSTSSFRWAMNESDFATAMLNGGDKPIKDEYGKLYTLEEFHEILCECKVIFYDSTGQNFS